MIKFWYELAINGSKCALEEYQAQLFENDDVLAITFSALDDDEEIFEVEPGEFQLWKENQITLLFSDDVAALRTVAALALNPEQYQLKVLPNEDWVSKCHDLFQPKQFGERVWLYPSWSTPPKPEAINICLDPGMAFGTGEHETTTLCLEWLDAHFKSGHSVVDYGCGTAVLGIAAALLGASHVEAVDIDMQAVEASSHNVNANNVTDLVSVYHTDEFSSSTKYDVILANILARPLIQLRPLFNSLMHEQSELIVSGVLASQYDWIVSQFNEYFTCTKKYELNGWLCLCFTKKNT